MSDKEHKNTPAITPNPSSNNINLTQSSDIHPKENSQSFTDTEMAIANKFLNVSYQDFKKILNNIDPKEHDGDLEFIMDFIIGLSEAITYCNQLEEDQKFSPVFREIYQHQYSKITYYTQILEKFAWFSEFKKINKRFDYLNGQA